MVWSWFDGFMLVLYVCERVGSNAGCAMAADRERSSARIGSSRIEVQDLTQGFPIQISLPDGETHHHQFNPSLRHNGGPEQEAELIRGYLKPPENKCLTDVEEISSQRSCHMRVIGDRDDYGGTTHCNIPLLLQPHRSNTSSTHHHPQHRHSSPLESSSNPCQLLYNSRGSSADTSSFSLSSSTSSMASFSTSGNSPRARKANFQKQFLPPFFSPIKDKGETPSRRQQSQSGVSFGYRITNPLFSETSTTSALADIAVVPCGSASASPTSFLSNIGQSEQMPRLQGAYNPPIPHEHYLRTEEDDPPPVYSDVIDNPSLYRSVSKLERRTNSGKI